MKWSVRVTRVLLETVEKASPVDIPHVSILMCFNQRQKYQFKLTKEKTILHSQFRLRACALYHCI